MSYPESVGNVETQVLWPMDLWAIAPSLRNALRQFGKTGGKLVENELLFFNGSIPHHS